MCFDTTEVAILTKHAPTRISGQSTDHYSPGASTLDCHCFLILQDKQIFIQNHYLNVKANTNVLGIEKLVTPIGKVNIKELHRSVLN